MIYSCAEHFERALDDFVMDNAAAPDILPADAASRGTEGMVPLCHYCERPAAYVFQKPVPENEHAEVLNP